MLFLDARAARITWTVFVFAATVGLIYLLRGVLLLAAFSLFFAYLIFPLVALTQRLPALQYHRTAAIAVVYVVLLGALVGASIGLVPRITREITTLTSKIPDVSQEVETGTIVGSILGRFGLSGERARQIQVAVRVYAAQITEYAQQAVAGLLKWVTGAWVIILIPIFGFFILKDADRAWTGVDSLIEERRRRQLLRDIAQDVHQLLGEYVRALIILGLVTFVVWLGLFLAAGVPGAAALAAIGGALEFIPVVGPLVSGVIVMSAAILGGYSHPWLLLAFLVLWRGIQDYVTSPLVMGRGIEIHPGLLIFGVIAGGEVAGPAGMFLSVPVIAALRVVWHRVRAFHRAGSARPVRAASEVR